MTAPHSMRCSAPTFVLLLLLGTSSHANAQGRCGGGITWPTLSDRVDLLHNLNTTKEVAQPALLQLSVPDSGPSSGMITAAAKLSLCETPLVSIGPFIDYSWNSLVDKRQNSLRVGLDADLQWRATGSTAAGHSPLALLQANYKSDREKKSDAVQGVVQLTWVTRNQSWPAPNATWRLGQVGDLTWAPYVGIVIDHIYSASDTLAEGTILRGTAQIDAALYPVGVKLDRRIEVFSSFVFRQDLSDPTSETDDVHPWFRGGINLFLVRDDNRAAGISIVRVDGEDPSKGFERQRYWQAGLTLRVK